MKGRIAVKVSILICMFACMLSLNSFSVFANSAEPIRSDEGSGIVFKQHEFVQIQSEILDITINDDLTANIVATYIMKNSSSESLSVETMFITSVTHGENKDISVQKNTQELDYNLEFYGDYSYSGNLAKYIEDWESVLESARESSLNYDENRYVGAIVYYVDFEPNEELQLKVSYTYQLGTSGYRTTARLLYYLTPAKYWKDFANIEINLTLAKEYKTLKSSSLDFEKIDNKHYKFSADTLPNTELRIEISDNSLASCLCSTIKIDKSSLINLLLITLFSIFILYKKQTPTTKKIPNSNNHIFVP